MTTPRKSEFAFKVKFLNYLEAKPGRTAEQIGGSICDAIRYTWALPEASYVDGVGSILRQMQDKDFQLLRLVNFWPTPYFKGIVSVWRDAGGQVFEQQYHTEDGVGAREYTFDIYTRLRDPRISPNDRAKLRAHWREAMATVDVPPGAEDFASHPPEASRGVPVPPLASPPFNRVIWYALADLLGGWSPTAACGVVRRTITPDGEHDEAFGKDSATGQVGWKPTWLLYSAERGDLAHSFTEINEHEAHGIAERLTSGAR